MSRTAVSPVQHKVDGERIMIRRIEQNVPLSAFFVTEGGFRYRAPADTLGPDELWMGIFVPLDEALYVSATEKFHPDSETDACLARELRPILLWQETMLASYEGEPDCPDYEIRHLSTGFLRGLSTSALGKDINFGIVRPLWERLEEKSEQLRTCEQVRERYLHNVTLVSPLFPKRKLPYLDFAIYDLTLWGSDRRLTAEEWKIFINHRLQREQEEIRRLENSLEATEDASRRERISEVVRNEVWRRDQGRCTQCGSQRNLEFDHIIPFAHGGGSTARNIQLLCESCNRSKGALIG